MLRCAYVQLEIEGIMLDMEVDNKSDRSTKEECLWVAVIARAILDTKAESNKPYDLLMQSNAIEWFENDIDFVRVCWWAGLEPEYVRKLCKEFMGDDYMDLCKKLGNLYKGNRKGGVKRRLDDDDPIKEVQEEIQEEIEKITPKLSNLLQDYKMLSTALEKNPNNVFIQLSQQKVWNTYLQEFDRLRAMK